MQHITCMARTQQRHWNFQQHDLHQHSLADGVDLFVLIGLDDIAVLQEVLLHDIHGQAQLLCPARETCWPQGGVMA